MLRNHNFKLCADHNNTINALSQLLAPATYLKFPELDKIKQPRYVRWLLSCHWTYRSLLAGHRFSLKKKDIYLMKHPQMSIQISETSHQGDQVTRLGNFSSIGLLLEDHYVFLKRWSSTKKCCHFILCYLFKQIYLIFT